MGGLCVFVFGVLLGLHSNGSFELYCISFSGLSIFCAQLSVSFSNDYFDYWVDRFAAPTMIAGGSGVLRSYPELRPVAIKAAWLLTCASLILTIFVIMAYDMSWFFGVLVVAGNLLGWSYSAPPIRLVDRGLGELTVAGITGLMLPTVGYLSTKTSFSMLFALFLIPALVYATVFIVLVEIPDMKADRKGKKLTMITMWGERFGFYLVSLFLVGNFGYFLWLSTLPLSFSPLNIEIIAMLSVIPFVAMIFSYQVAEKDQQFATKLAIRGIIYLVSYLIVVNIYLLYSLY
jgi:1,4-dihydroxy-2-naphthoate octaprenyltransferase